MTEKDKESFVAKANSKKTEYAMTLQQYNIVELANGTKTTGDNKTCVANEMLCKIFWLTIHPPCAWQTQPKKICSQIGLCTFDVTRGVSMGIESVVDKENAKLSNGVGDAACFACEMAVVWIQSQLRQNMTQERILDFINDLCERLPSPMGETVVDCAQLSTLPTISLTIGGKVFNLAPEEYVLKVGEGPAAQCISGFIALDVAPPRRPLCILEMCSWANTTLCLTLVMNRSGLQRQCKHDWIGFMYGFRVNNLCFKCCVGMFPGVKDFES